MRTETLGKQNLIRTVLIAGYILAVLLFSGLARADVRLHGEAAADMLQVSGQQSSILGSK